MSREDLLWAKDKDRDTKSVEMFSVCKTAMHTDDYNVKWKKF